MDRHPGESTTLPELEATASDGMTSRGVLALRTALQAALRAGARDDDGVRRAVALFCGEARRREMRAEQVLVLLKETWRTLPEVRRLGRAQRELTLAHLTTLAIRTFYESDARLGQRPGDDTAPAPPR